MALSEEERAQLEELQRKLKEPDDTDKFDVEIWDETGKGAKVPYHKGKSWLQKTFGIDLDPPTDSADGDQGDPDPVKTRKPPAQKYFGSKGK